MQEAPIISVIIPVYNVAPYVEQCLQSVLNQTYDNIEIIVVDDCGIDDSMAIVERIKKEYKGNKAFKIVHHEHNRGLSAARNTGVEVANGRYISFIDSDDWIAPNMIEFLLTAANKGEYGIVSCLPLYGTPEKLDIFCEDWILEVPKVIESTDIAEELLLKKTCHTAWGKLFFKEILCNTVFREGKINEDTLFAYDAFPYLEENKINMKVIPEHLYFYRKTENGICKSHRRPFHFAEYENLLEIIQGIKKRKKTLHTKLSLHLANRIIKDMKLMVLNEKKYNKKHYLELSNILKKTSLSTARNPEENYLPRDYFGFRFIPIWYKNWYITYVLHRKPTPTEHIRIYIGDKRQKLFCK